MKSSLKKIKDCKVKLTVEVEAKTVESRFQEVLRDFQKNVRLPGFREGKAPVDLIEKNFLKEAHEEVLKSLIPAAYHESIVTQKVSPVTLPAISEIKMERGSNLTFTAEFEKSPDVPIRNYKGIRLKRDSAEVQPADIEKATASLLEFHIDQEKKIPVLDEAFAKKFGKNTVEELKEAIRRDVASYKHSESLSKMKKELYQKLLELVAFVVPQELVEKQKESLLIRSHQECLRSGMPESEWEAQKERFEAEATTKAQEQVKLYFILQKIAQLEGIQAEEGEIQKRLESLAQQSQRPMEEVQRVFADDLRESIREEKTVAFLIANAKLEEINLSLKQRSS